jgi:hypothetical protein
MAHEYYTRREAAVGRQNSIHALKRVPVLVVDLAAHFGDLPFLLNLDPESTLVDAGRPRRTPRLLQRQ